ncbi:MAG TPA: ABC transporter ATP-binding protein, partial [Gaiellales bacterium]|nr:ABC transporter ATP-binding protein [Gaiellales bacterium]
MSESAAPGTWVGLIGPNGAGKSSLLRAIAHLVAHDGVVRVGDEPIGRLSRRRRAQLIAYVPQQPELPAEMRVFDYTLLGRTPHIGYFGVESEQDRRHCADLLDRIDMAGLAERHLATLSGGELQR